MNAVRAEHRRPHHGVGRRAALELDPWPEHGIHLLRLDRADQRHCLLVGGQPVNHGVIDVAQHVDDRVAAGEDVYEWCCGRAHVSYFARVFRLQETQDAPSRAAWGATSTLNANLHPSIAAGVSARAAVVSVTVCGEYFRPALGRTSWLSPQSEEEIRSELVNDTRFATRRTSLLVSGGCEARLVTTVGASLGTRALKP